MAKSPWVIQVLTGKEEEKEKELSANVSSSAISQLRWKDNVLTVVFHRGGTIEYEFQASQEEYYAFVNAPSKGAYFNAHYPNK